MTRSKGPGYLALVGALLFVTAHAADNSAAGAASSEELSEVVVTGSRVITNGNDSPTPVTVLSTDEFLKLQPTTVTEAVNLMPALQGSQNVTSRPGGGQRDGAGSYFNLRNMGDLRTLVLFDGMRLIPTYNQNQANTNSQIVPQMLLKRVDVVTGGVAAVYGSDAVSGVVNFVTDRDFNGVKFQGSEGVSDYNDDRISDYGIAAGSKFADNRGHVEGSFEWHEDAGIVNRGDSTRPFFAQVPGGGGDGVTVPYFNMYNQRMSNTSFSGLLLNSASNGALRDLEFTPSGTLTPFQHGLIPTASGLVPFSNSAKAVPANVESGGDGAWNNLTSLKAAIKFTQAFVRLDYDLADSVHAYAQGAYTDIETRDNYQSPQINSVRISYANPFLSTVQAPYNAVLAANPNGVLTFSRFLDIVPRAEQYTHAYMAYAGLNGTMGSYKWDVNIGNSKSQITALNFVNIDNGRLFAAIDAVTNSSGQIVCRAAQTNPDYTGCVPLNLFGGAPSQASLDYILKQAYNLNRTRMDDANASLTGAPFNTWAGPVNVALSGEWRRLRWDARSNAGPNDLADCVGIGTGVNNALRNCTQGVTKQWFSNTMGSLPTVTQTVGEAAGEFDAPLLKGLPLTDELDFTGAFRFTHYNTSGNVTTWKGGLDWRIDDNVKLRATRSRDVRAPNLFDLYAPIQLNPGFNITDPLTNSTFTVTNQQTSNPNLRPETANTLTAGFVLTPQVLPNFSLSMDYYRIKVDDVIFLLQGFSQPVLNLCEAVHGAAPACAYIQRANWTDTNPVTNPITGVSSTYLNIANQDTWGIDTEANYGFTLFGHRTSLRLLSSYQPRLIYDQGPLTGGVLSVAGAYNTGTNRIAAAPKLKLTGLLSFDVSHNFNVTVLERWRSTLKAIYNDTLMFVNPTLPSLAYTTVTLSYTHDTQAGAVNVFLNVQNLFNKFPTVYYAGPAGYGLNQALPEGDDPIGRYYTLGVRFKM
jgi:outer membrane receptor protein involved in Fe transport